MYISVCISACGYAMTKSTERMCQFLIRANISTKQIVFHNTTGEYVDQ